LLFLIGISGCSQEHYAIVVNCSREPLRIQVFHGGVEMAMSMARPNSVVRIDGAVFTMRNTEYIFRLRHQNTKVTDVTVTAEYLRANEWIVPICGDSAVDSYRLDVIH